MPHRPFGPPPMPPPPASEPQGILWAFVPFLTLGFGTPFSFLYAAMRRNSWNLGMTALGYGVGTGAVLMLMGTGEPLTALLGSVMMMMLWIAGSAHSFAVRGSVFPRANPHSRHNAHAIEVARYRRMLRADARGLAAEDPGLAHELRIGRPDLPRAYDDGGLIDVNHAPPPVLATLPGLSPELVERVVSRRGEQGGFVSAEELSVDADLPPEVLPKLAEYAIFLP
ncbi:ComEA family DNA-binding protein [Actinomadura xylanilytica]|uniref:ComEA family DNA-binding protein n=1 Tax=Actinomadura xylanilytica TaxID=887459 RepID=UPI00255B1603|nr:helix-hairpin-helix domain-containing protein [Actinomadura xylanilytica]MDL4777612.1 helix-hairpin-helix domain-containing protein [Actinomadura xylanilytica]